MCEQIWKAHPLWTPAQGQAHYKEAVLIEPLFTLAEVGTEEQAQKEPR